MGFEDSAFCQMYNARSTRHELMPKAKPLTVRCATRRGTLAQVAKELGNGKVNMLAFVTTTAATKGYVQVVVDNVKKAKKALDGAGLSYSEADVLHVELANVPSEHWQALPESCSLRRSTSASDAQQSEKARRRQVWCSRSLTWTRRLGFDRHSKEEWLLP
jgi:hypothetical protein